MARLALDTTGRACAVGLRREGADDVVRVERIGRGHAERLAPMAQSVIEEAGLTPADLTEIIVACGPGGFAGIRVGVAFARGLGLATGAEVFGAHNLDMIALQIFKGGSGEAGPLAVLHDAKREEVVWRGYRGGAPVSEMERLPAEEAEAAVRAALGPQAAIAGSGAALLNDFKRLDTIEADIATLLDAPRERLVAPSPIYVRPPDAKLPQGLPA